MQTIPFHFFFHFLTLVFFFSFSPFFQSSVFCLPSLTHNSNPNPKREKKKAKNNKTQKQQITFFIELLLLPPPIIPYQPRSYPTLIYSSSLPSLPMSSLLPVDGVFNVASDRAHISSGHRSSSASVADKDDSDHMSSSQRDRSHSKNIEPLFSETEQEKQLMNQPFNHTMMDMGNGLINEKQLQLILKVNQEMARATLITVLEQHRSELETERNEFTKKFARVNRRYAPNGKRKHESDTESSSSSGEDDEDADDENSEEDESGSEEEDGSDDKCKPNKKKQKTGDSKNKGEKESTRGSTGIEARFTPKMVDFLKTAIEKKGLESRTQKGGNDLIERIYQNLISIPGSQLEDLLGISPENFERHFKPVGKKTKIRNKIISLIPFPFTPKMVIFFKQQIKKRELTDPKQDNAEDVIDRIYNIFCNVKEEDVSKVLDVDKEFFEAHFKHSSEKQRIISKITSLISSVSSKSGSDNESESGSNKKKKESDKKKGKKSSSSGSEPESDSDKKSKKGKEKPTSRQSGDESSSSNKKKPSKHHSDDSGSESDSKSKVKPKENGKPSASSSSKSTRMEISDNEDKPKKKKAEEEPKPKEKSKRKEESESDSDMKVSIKPKLVLSKPPSSIAQEKKPVPSKPAESSSKSSSSRSSEEPKKSSVPEKSKEKEKESDKKKSSTTSSSSSKSGKKHLPSSSDDDTGSSDDDNSKPIKRSGKPFKGKKSGKNSESESGSESDSRHKGRYDGLKKDPVSDDGSASE